MTMIERSDPCEAMVDPERACINCGMELEFVSLIREEGSGPEMMTLRCPRCRYVKKVCV